MAPPVPKIKTKKQKKKEKEKAERGPVLGNFDHKPTIMTTLRPAIRVKRTTKKLSFTQKKSMRKRARVERRQMQKALLKKLKRPIALLPEPSLEPDMEEELEKKTPPMHFKVNARTKCLEARVTLHHCPPQFINLDLTTTHFKLDTLKWTRKYQVEVPYIEGAQCDPAGATAKIEHGILCVSVPITHLPEVARKKQASLSAAIREGRRRRFVQARGGEVVGMRLVPAKERKRKRGEDDDEHVPIVRTGPKKKFVMDREVLTSMAAEAAATEESKVAGRQAKLGATEAYFKELRTRKMEKKENKKSIVDRVVERLVNQQRQQIGQKVEAQGLSERPVLAAGVDARTRAARGAKKVSFASTNLVVKFGGQGEGSGEKKKKGRKSPEDKVITYGN